MAFPCPSPRGPFGRLPRRRNRGPGTSRRLEPFLMASFLAPSVLGGLGLELFFHFLQVLFNGFACLHERLVRRLRTLGLYHELRVAVQGVREVVGSEFDA